MVLCLAMYKAVVAKYKFSNTEQTAKILLTSNKVMEEQSSRFICIMYKAEW